MLSTKYGPRVRRNGACDPDPVWPRGKVRRFQVFLCFLRTRNDGTGIHRIGSMIRGLSFVGVIYQRCP